MPFILTGKSKCVICGEVIIDDYLSFSAFLPKHHKFYAYSDAVFHHSCFLNWEDHDEFQKLYNRFREIWESRPKDLSSLQEINDWGKEALKEFLEITDAN